MLIARHSIQTKASPEKVWKIWEDVANWKTWDESLEYSFLNGPFETGTTGKLKAKGGPAVKTLLTLVDPMRSFTDTSQLPLTRIHFTHSLTPFEEGTEITHQIEMKGFLAPLFAFLIGRGMKKNLADHMQALVQQAEKNEPT